jgi:FkbM family methyltransferase
MNWAFMLDTGPFHWITRKIIWKFRKAISDPIQSIRLPTGLELFLFSDNAFSSDVFVTTCDVDWGAEALFARFLNQEGALLDVGAHIGYYSLYMLPLVKRVYAFDPNPDVQKWLRKNLDRYPNAHVVQKAVGKSAGKQFFVPTTTPDLAHLDYSNADPRAIEVDIVTIDGFVATEGLKVSGIKIDVEGYDLDVIIGSRSTLIEQQPLVLTEARPDNELFNVLAETNYAVFAFTKDHRRKKSFEQIAGDTEKHTKMLFLVPPRLFGEFRKQITSMVQGD